MTFQPSGEQLELRHGDHRAVIVEVGGGLRSYDCGDTPVIDGYAPDEMASAGRGQILFPWPNRVADGTWEWEGSTLQLPLTQVKHSNAMHGLTRWSNWRLERLDEGVGSASYVLAPQPGYPFRLACSVGYRLDDDGLTVTTTVVNESDRAAPFGIGFHPYLAVPGGADEATLTLPASTRLLVDDRGIPQGREEVDGTSHDFRGGRKIGELKLDDPFTDLQRDAGRTEVVLATSDREVVVWMDGTFRYTQVFTGDTVPQEDRRRKGVAIEPMTCPPNALASGEALVVLQPDETFEGVWGISVPRLNG